MTQTESSIFRLPVKSPIVIGSPGFLRFLQRWAERIRHSQSPVLISGETGTGKSLIARWLFERSNTYKKVLRVLPLAEIPEDLFESQLFGHRKGSFTTAQADFPGKIKAADGGTLLLEEISSLPDHLQAKLLRLLQDGEFERIGETETVSVDLRILATTNVPLIESVRQGIFRADLYFRLNVLRLEIEPLRDRSEDLEPLAAYFLHAVSTLQHKSISCISPEALSVLHAYPWPGNIRELKSEIEYAVSMVSAQQTTLHPDDLSPTVLTNRPPFTHTPLSLAEDLKRVEKQRIVDALVRSQGNRNKAARRLGISRRTLYNKLSEFKIRL